MDNLCFDKRFVVSLTILDFDEKCHFFNFATIMITGLGFGLKDTGLGFEDYWPWPRTRCPRTHPWCKDVMMPTNIFIV